jgi:hypothetical protein
VATSGFKMFLSMIGKVAVYSFYMILIYITYFFFMLSIMKAILGFAIYLKIAVLMGLIFVPPAVGLAYFVPLRGLAMNLIKQVLVLVMLTAAYGKAYAVVFNNDALNTVVTLALKDGAAAAAAKAAHNDGTVDEIEEMVVTVSEIVGPDRMASNPDSVDSVAFFATLDIGRIREVFLAVSRGVMMMGMMVILIGKVYEIMSGALDGAYDPSDLLRRQALETHQAMGHGEGGGGH